MIKSIINYYYNLIPKEIRKTEEHYIFESNNIEYEFFPFFGDINILYKNYNVLISSNKYVHEIIYNNQGSIITIFKNTPYLLIKKNENSNAKLDIDYIIDYDIVIYDKFKLSWKALWKDKIDYYEIQIKELSSKYPIAYSSFSYYAGLGELAISILNYVDYDDISFSISHKRIGFGDTQSTFCNPTNIIVDSKVRDISEYIKVNYFQDNLSVVDVISIIRRLNLSNSDVILFISRMIYPSYYFDTYDKVIQSKCDETKLSYYTKKTADYEQFLKRIYSFLKTKYTIPYIEFLD